MLKECEAPDSSIAEVARKHQLNANLVHRWRRGFQRSQAPQREDFVALPMLVPPVVQSGINTSIKVELLLPTGPIVLHWPLSEARQLAVRLHAKQSSDCGLLASLEIHDH